MESAKATEENSTGVRHVIEQAAKDWLENCMQLTSHFFEDWVKTEQRLTRQYEGRELFELLQNIDDASGCATEKVAVFTLKDDYLCVENNGEPFTADTFLRLCEGGLSSKSQKYIGCKGIGFRSVLNVADRVEICSGDGRPENMVSACFSTEFAQRQLDRLLSSSNEVKQHIRRQSQNLRGNGFVPDFPFFRAPHYLTPLNKDHTTCIRLHLKNRKTTKRLLQEIKDFDSKVVMLLPHITRLTFRVEGENTRIIRRKEKLLGSGQKEYTVETIELDNNGTEHAIDTSVFRFTEKALDLNAMALADNPEGADDSASSTLLKMGVAIPTDGKKITELPLYTFFPVKDVKSPFPALLHATFSLRDNRNELELSTREDKRTNRRVFTELLRFYLESVLDFFKPAPERADMGDADKNARANHLLYLLKPLTFHNGAESFDGVFHSLDQDQNEKLLTVYLNLCREKDVFRATCLCESGQPIVADRFPESFSGAEFGNLLTVKPELIDFAYRIGARCISEAEDELLLSLNKASRHWQDTTDRTSCIRMRVEAFRWWHHQKLHSLPELLKDNNGHFLTATAGNDTCYLSGGIKDLPEWANIRMLDPEYEKELISTYHREIDERNAANPDKDNDTPKRILGRILSDSPARIMEQSSREIIISPVSRCVSNYNQAKDFLRWLWKIWKEKPFSKSVQPHDFRLPNADGGTSHPKNLYLGKVFDNESNARVFCCLDSFHELADIFFEEDSDRSEFYTFLGIHTTVPFSATDSNIDPEYEARFFYPKKFETVSCNVYTSPYLNEILEKADTPTIFNWIFGDRVLWTEHLLLHHEPSSSWCKGQPWDRRRNPEKICDYWELPSYLGFVFARKPWLAVGDTKFAPRDFLLSEEPLLENAGLHLLRKNQIDIWAKECGRSPEDLKNLLVHVGVRESVPDLEAPQFYSLLLYLGNCSDENAQKAKTLSKRLYREVTERSLKDKKRDFCRDCDEKQEFLAQGKVLVKELTEFKPVCDVRFSSSAVLNPQKNWVIDTPARQGNKEDIETIFGVKPYQREYEIINTVEAGCNADFLPDFNDFMRCLRMYRPLRNFPSAIRVNLVSQATVKELANPTQSLVITDKYQILGPRLNQAIVVGNETDYSKLKPALYARLSDILYIALDSPSREFINKAALLFRCTPEERRADLAYDGISPEDIDFVNNEHHRSCETDLAIEALFSNEPEEVRQRVGEISWNYTSTADCQAKIKEILRLSRISLADIEKTLNYKISFGELNRKLLKQELNRRENYYRAEVYRRLLPKESSWPGLRDAWEKYKSIDNAHQKAIDDVGFNAESAVETAIQKLCATLPPDADDSPEADYKQWYDKNRSLLLNIDKTADYIDGFLNISHNDNLMYFPAGERLTRIFSEYIKEQTAHSRQKTDSELSDDSLLSMLDNTTIELPARGKLLQPGATDSRSKTVNMRKQAEDNNHNSSIGETGELLVLLHIWKKRLTCVKDFFGHTPYDIYWISGYGRRHKRHETECIKYYTSNGGDDSGYDFRLEGSDGSRLYLEVKSSSGRECSFIMSANEYEKACKLNKESPGCYKIIFVSGINPADKNCAPGLSVLDIFSNTNDFKKEATHYHFCYDPHKET